MKALVVASIANFITGFEINDIKILTDLGYEVHCATNYNDAREERLNRLSELHVINHQIDFNRSPLNKGNINAYKQLKALFAQENFDIVHCHTPIGGVLSRLIGAKYRRHGLKMIYTAHGFHFFKGAPLKNWVMFYPIEKFLSRFTDILITINKEDYNRALKRFHAKKVQYIPGVGLDTKKFEICEVDKDAKREGLGIAEKDFVFLSVGELQDRKNQGIVIDAFISLKTKGMIDGLKYLIVGEGENKKKYQKLIDEYGLNGHIKLLGYRTDIDELCAISDCFIHPSIREGLGIAPLEGMASGLPLLCSNVNGIKDYANNGVTGITFNPHNVNEVENAIIKISSDAEFREKCALNNIIVARKYDIAQTDQIMRIVYGGGYSHLEAVLTRHNIRKQLGIGKSAFVIITVGEVNNNKNQSVIIEAMASLGYPDVYYIVCGEGEQMETLKKKTIELQLEERVFFLGYRPDVHKYLKASDVFAFPSRREGLGIAAIEAMSSSLPLLTSDVHGINDYLIEGETGYKYHPCDVNGFACGIKRFRDDNYQAVRIGNRCRKLAKKYDISIVDSIMRKVYSFDF